MKLLCSDQEYCGFLQKVTDDFEFNLDLSKKIHVCPNCNENLAMLVEDTYQLQTYKPKEPTLNIYISELEKIIKL
jgi:hypothetical protein